MKVVYLWENGQPVIVTLNSDGEFDYPSEKWTEQPPPGGIFAPFYFDGQKWVGQTREEFEKTLPPEPVDEKDVIISNLSQQLLKTQSEVESVKQDVATVLSLLIAKGSVDNV